VFNMDLPWNPAVLEQRIGRIHRLGQRQPVRVVNFVAKGTIEEGMLSVLSFKKSLFAGVLDGGAANISLGGSKLNKFMETVESVTAGIPAATPGDEAREAQTEFNGKPSRRQPAADGAADDAAGGAAWAGLLQAGMAFLQQLAAPQAGGAGPVRRDPTTGESYLRLPIPAPELVEQALGALGGLLERLRK
jgi:hypothetical protein